MLQSFFPFESGKSKASSICGDKRSNTEFEGGKSPKSKLNAKELVTQKAAILRAKLVQLL